MPSNRLMIARELIRIARICACGTATAERTAYRHRKATYGWSMHPDLYYSWFTGFDGFEKKSENYFSNSLDGILRKLVSVSTLADSDNDTKNSQELRKKAYDAIIEPAKQLLKELDGMPEKLWQACVYMRDALHAGAIHRIYDDDNYNPFIFKGDDDKDMQEFKKKYGSAPTKQGIDECFQQANAVTGKWKSLADQVMSLMKADAVAERVRNAVGIGKLSRFNPFNSKKVDAKAIGQSVEKLFEEWKELHLQKRNPQEYVDEPYEVVSRAFRQKDASRVRLTKRLKA